MTGNVLIVGVGLGLSYSLAKLFYKEGMKVILASRNVEKLKDISLEIDANVYQCDASEIKEVENLFNRLDDTIGTPDLVIYNPSARVRGPVGNLDPIAVKKALDITCFGAFLVAQEATKRMLKAEKGSIFFTAIGSRFPTGPRTLADGLYITKSGVPIVSSNRLNKFSTSLISLASH